MWLFTLLTYPLLRSGKFIAFLQVVEKMTMTKKVSIMHVRQEIATHKASLGNCNGMSFEHCTFYFSKTCNGRYGSVGICRLRSEAGIFP